MSEERSALARWSQRKLAAKRGDPAPAAADDDALEARPASQQYGPERQSPSPAEAGEAKPAADAPLADDKVPTLPPVEELTAQSDYTVFLAKGVPEALTRAALRKLWLSDPVLANLDGLNNYDEDYNLIDHAITAAQTSYQPGLGHLGEIEDRLAQLENSIEPLEGRRSGKPESNPPAHDHGAGAPATLRPNDAAELGTADASQQSATGGTDGDTEITAELTEKSNK